jgi:uncharacterized protein (DUF488 family)
MKNIFSIGHSTIEIEEFIKILQANNIEALIDTRGVPYSKFAPQFNQENLKNHCRLTKIKYGHAPALCGKNTITHIEPTKEMIEALEKIKNLKQTYNVCIMGANKNYEDCHRYQLCELLLSKFNENVIHILLDGTTLSHGSIKKQIGLF